MLNKYVLSERSHLTAASLRLGLGLPRLLTGLPLLVRFHLVARGIFLKHRHLSPYFNPCMAPYDFQDQGFPLNGSCSLLWLHHSTLPNSHRSSHPELLRDSHVEMLSLFSTLYRARNAWSLSLIC